jgi:hypothetical protein
MEQIGEKKDISECEKMFQEDMECVQFLQVLLIQYFDIYIIIFNN